LRTSPSISPWVPPWSIASVMSSATAEPATHSQECPRSLSGIHRMGPYATAYLHNAATGRIHVAYFSLAPFPGQIQHVVKRWRCKGHHTIGAETQVAAERHMAELHDALGLESDMVPDLGHIDWDGETGLVLLAGPDGKPISPRIQGAEPVVCP
jgi:peptidyl-tRNA hydrolase